jgi:HSP20 family protein
MESNTMAETNVERRQEERGRGAERRPQGGELSRRGEMGFPSLWRSPDELFSLSPFTLMRRLTEDLDRMFSGFGAGGGREMGVLAPPVDVRESNGNLVVTTELPGLSKDDVQVEVEQDRLIIRGERKREQEENREGVHRSERYYGAFYREIPLPDGVKADQAKAQFNNGVLEITMPIAEEQRRKRAIPIEAGEGERKPVGSQQAGKQTTQTSKAG